LGIYNFETDLLAWTTKHDQSDVPELRDQGMDKIFRDKIFKDNEALQG